VRIAFDEWNYWYGSYEYGELGVRYFLKDGLGIAAGLHELFRNSARGESHRARPTRASALYDAETQKSQALRMRLMSSVGRLAWTRRRRASNAGRWWAGPRHRQQAPPLLEEPKWRWGDPPRWPAGLSPCFIIGRSDLKRIKRDKLRVRQRAEEVEDRAALQNRGERQLVSDRLMLYQCRVPQVSL